MASSSEADDIRPDNPPASPETLACLENALVKSHYDLRAIYRLILNSRTYQQSSLAENDNTDPAVLFAHYTIRRLDAEVLQDALCWIGGTGVGYTSATPEPYTFIPKENRTIALADGSITSTFLATFGRPARDTGLLAERDNRVTDSQRLYLLNSSDMQRMITQSPRLREVILSSMKNPTVLIRNLYVTILSRYPTPDEVAVAEQYFKSSGAGRGPPPMTWHGRSSIARSFCTGIERRVCLDRINRINRKNFIYGVSWAMQFTAWSKG